jgi:ATP-binding cassette, subfamily B, bacterial
VLGVDRVVTGHLTPGELLVLLAYVRMTQSPIRQLAKLSYSTSKAGASLERIREVLNIEPTVVQRPGATALVIGSPAAVAFRDVTFGYTTGRPVLHDIFLEASPGQLVALVGATGSGKSTLVSLLPRFYDPWSGSVLINGQDVRDFTLSSLRANVAVVLQDSLIFRTTVLDNIAYGRPDAPRGDIIAAAEAAGVSAIAARLEDGYDTVVSERGASLSGGEKQCIGIARAMLKDAPIVVLDEPTSAMDAHTERLVMSGVERLLQERTGLIIAHRLPTVMKADLVAVLDAGRVAELGEPAALLSDPSSRFAALARAQLISQLPPRSVAKQSPGRNDAVAYPAQPVASQGLLGRVLTRARSH